MEGRALVGREHEIRAIDDAIATTLNGAATVLLLSGEPGIGKTRLLEELAARVARQGGSAAWGRTSEVGLTPSFWPWIQVLAALETTSDRAPPLGSLETHTDAALRLSRFSQVLAFLRRRAAAAPVALLLDDLHAADPSSLQLLEFLLPGLLGHRVLFALAARDTDGTRDAVASLSRIQRSAARLPLARLGASEVQQLVGARADATRVFELSEGNPLFISELLASLHSRGVLGLPQLSSVRTVIAERVAKLPQETRAALRAAAIVGREFHVQIVAEILGISDSVSALKPALDLGMLTQVSADRFRFSHALVAEALNDELNPAERADLHLKAARAIERRAQNESGTIAHHLLAAGDRASNEAVLACQKAALACMAQLAFEDAALLLERALGALAVASPNDPRRRAQLLCARAEALQHATQHAPAVAACDEAAQLVRSLPASDFENQLFAQIALVRGLEFRFGRSDPLLIELLREALDKLGNASAPLRAKLLARLAAAEQPARDSNGPVILAFEAIALSKELADRDRLEVMYVATAALVDYVQPDQLEPIHREVLALARGSDRTISVHTRLRLCFTTLERLDRKGFDTAVEVYVAEAVALGLPQWTRHIHMLSALTALLEGRFEDDDQATSRSEAISMALGDNSAQFIIDVHRSMSAWVRTTPLDAKIRARITTYVPGRAVIEAWLAVQDGNHDATRAALHAIDDHVVNDPDLGAMVGTAVAFAGDRDQAVKTYDTLAPRQNRIALTSMVGCAVMDLYDRVLLVLATTARNWDAIDAHAERALVIAHKLGSPVWAARVQADWADALIHRANPGDRERAADLRQQAFDVAQRLGMPGLLSRCNPEATAASTGRGSAQSADSSGKSSEKSARVTFARHGELWVVTGFGEKIHVKDSRGIQMIARLTEQPDSALHALDLSGGIDAADGGDAGPALDHTARAQYRARLVELAQERDEAESLGDRGRIEHASHEIEALSAEIERAFGLGGRERKVGSASERARSNVQRRISHGIEQIRAVSPRLGEHLAACLHTGTYCVYRPG